MQQRPSQGNLNSLQSRTISNWKLPEKLLSIQSFFPYIWYNVDGAGKNLENISEFQTWTNNKRISADGRKNKGQHLKPKLLTVSCISLLQLNVPTFICYKQTADDSNHCCTCALMCFRTREYHESELTITWDTSHNIV